MQLTIKCSNDTKVTVDAEPENTVAELKALVAKSLSELPSDNQMHDTPADAQRLIYAGRVLKDDDVLSTYKMANGHTVHLVKLNKTTAPTTSQASPASAVASAGPSPIVPTTPSNTPVTPTNPGVNPLAAFQNMGGSVGGFGGLGAMGGLGMGGGMPDADAMQALLSNDAFVQQMSQVMSQPGMIDMMLAQNPAFQGGNAPPEMRAMMQAMMSNPESLRQILQMGSAMRAGGMGAGLGPLGSMGNTPSTTTGVTPSMPAFNPALLQAMMGGVNPTPTDSRPPEERFQEQLRQLNDMGFYDAAKNIRALTLSGGSVEGAVELLFSQL